MHLDPRLIRQLNSLSEGLDDGADLRAIITVLIDDLTELDPSFLGLEMTVTAGVNPVTLSTLDGHEARLVQSSLLLPVGLMGGGHATTTVVYFAAAPGVFKDLAAEIRRQYRLDGQVVLDQHLTPSIAPGFSGLTELVAVNQAIGILIGRGHSVDEARAVLERDAAATHRTTLQAAQSVIDSIGH